MPGTIAAESTVLKSTLDGPRGPATGSRGCHSLQNQGPIQQKGLSLATTSLSPPRCPQCASPLPAIPCRNEPIEIPKVKRHALNIKSSGMRLISCTRFFYPSPLQPSTWHGGTEDSSTAGIRDVVDMHVISLCAQQFLNPELHAVQLNPDSLCDTQANP